MTADAPLLEGPGGDAIKTMVSSEPTSPRSRRRRGFSVAKGFQYLALLAYVFVLGFPLLWLVSASFKSSRELNSLGTSLIPREFVWENYINALERQNLIASIGNSLIVAISTVILTMLLSLPMAYALARLKGKLRAGGTVWILASQVFGHAPIKKAAHRHVIPVGGLRVKSVQPTFVKSLNVALGHAIGCRLAAECGEHSERVNLRLRRAPGPAFPCAAFARQSLRVNEPFDAILQQQPRCDLRRMPNLRCLSDCDR